MSRQLDDHWIVIRERTLLEILDLALRVVRTQGLPLLAAMALGAVPMFFLNDWLIGENVSITEDSDLDVPFEYLFQMALLIAAEMSLASAPATLYLGESLFHHKPSLGRLARNFLESLPQLFVYQVIVRVLCVASVFLSFVPYAAWPYLSEIILLERNAMFAGRKRRLSTYRRGRMLHGPHFGDLVVRSLAAGLIGLALIVALWLSIWALVSQLVGAWQPWDVAYRYYLPLGIWTVISYFTVVRFLSYLDLRIHSEGWEVELAMRAEAARLAQQPASL